MFLRNFLSKSALFSLLVLLSAGAQLTGNESKLTDIEKRESYQFFEMEENKAILYHIAHVELAKGTNGEVCPVSFVIVINPRVVGLIDGSKSVEDIESAGLINSACQELFADNKALQGISVISFDMAKENLRFYDIFTMQYPERFIRLK